jgi:hypothetical protein
MAMIEQLSPRLRASLRHRAVPYAGGGATLLLLLVLGLTPVWLDLTTDHSSLLIPGVLGVPTLLPGLRFTPLGDQSGLTVLCQDFAALLMVLVVAAVLGRHVRTYPQSGRLHRLRIGWAALVLAGAAAGFFRGLVVARLVAGGPEAYFGYPALGAASGAGYGLLLGWIPGIAALLAVGGGPVWRAVRTRIDPLWRLFLIHVYEPGSAVAVKAAGRGAKEWRDWRDRRGHRDAPRAVRTARTALTAFTARTAGMARVAGMARTVRAARTARGEKHGAGTGTTP